MNIIAWLFAYPFIWQTILSSLFTFGLVWSLVRILAIRDAGVKAWVFTLPILVPLLLPFKGQIGFIHWLSLLISEPDALLDLTGAARFLTLLCILPPVLLIGRGMVSYLAYCWVLRKVQEITANDEPRLFLLLASLAEKAGISLPRVYQLPSRHAQVFVCGIRRPRLVISPLLLSALPEAELEGVLAHEVAHLARRDQIASWVISLVSALMFYNPLLYPLVRRLNHEREKAADFLASQLTGQPRALAQGLLTVAKLALEEQREFYSPALPIAKLTSGEAIYERTRILWSEKEEPHGQIITQAWRFGVLFLSIEGLFIVFVLNPFLQHAACAVMVP
ncbi:MAG: M56 family metallopeptidase [Negativicutes bacterium]|nr:M56 family metallopeptidase [Negativicutes bacterium]